ncbi:disease resistance protein RPM1 [Vigna unguiculata]|uniref:Disease resistance protein RPM1 n=1 Tax=Vigna unguiculata TaxID=3917 RepID=A0A4D6MX42_VIGUN|nr:disease resistance protein RPM1 [Vigna unguiculata]
MAESLLFSFAESLLRKLATVAVQEASLALGVRSELKEMTETMEIIRGVLLDAQQKTPQSTALSEWLKRVKRVFSDAEDIVDDFECEALRKHVVDTSGSHSMKVRHFFSSSNPVVYSLRMAHRIQDINTRLAKLADQRNMFGLQIINQDMRVVRKEWESVRDNEIWNLQQYEKGILPALKLSYDQLPSYLKPCFASFFLYEHDYNVLCYDLSTVWDSLGFLPIPKEGESMTDVAAKVLCELRTRSFLSDDLEFGIDNVYEIHDLVSDLAVYIGKGVFERVNRRNPKISENAQHLVFEENNFYGEDLLPTGLRSVVFRDGGSNVDFLNTLLSRCRYLRILDLRYSEYESLPHCIGKLKHLRFLCLAKNEKLKELPDSVCKLQNLQTLILNGCIKLQKLPKGIKNLVSLRQLAITTAQTHFPEELIANFISLEILSFTECDNLESLFEGVQLSTVKSLILADCGSLKSVSLHAFRNLEVLMIDNCIKLELSTSLSSHIPDSKLKYIFLFDLPQLVKLPRWFQGSANTLQHLAITGCVNLDELPEWLTTLICLKVLDISDCPNLLSLPDNIHHLTNLEKLEITGCPELRKRFKPKVGQDWHKISHIKQVDIDDSDDEEDLSE